MSAYTGGSVPLPNSGDFLIGEHTDRPIMGTVLGGWARNTGLLDAEPYDANRDTRYRAPDGSVWVSQGAYEQGQKLKEAQATIRKLEHEISVLRFPVAGMGGEIDDERKTMEVWPADQEGDTPRAKFLSGACSFCGAEALLLQVDNSWEEYACVSVCQPCLEKMFDAFYKKVCG